MKNNDRRTLYKKQDEVERILGILKSLISDDIPKVCTSVNHPIVFVVGCARSGTTLVSQYLSDTKAYCFPSNLLSRFYYAPYVGSLVQKLIVDLDFKNELLGGDTNLQNYKSDLGKTEGALSPNEFWYYWRQFFHFGDIQQLSDKELEAVDIDRFINGLKSIQYVFNKPLLMKAMIANWHLSFLARNIPNSYYVFVQRDLVYNAQSILDARRKFFGTTAKWYSFKPPEYHILKQKAVEEQAVSQVYYTNKAIKMQLAEIPSKRTINVQYEDFCLRPDMLAELMNNKLGFHHRPGNQVIKNLNVKKSDTSEWGELQKYALEYSER